MIDSFDEPAGNLIFEFVFYVGLSKTPILASIVSESVVIVI